MQRNGHKLLLHLQKNLHRAALVEAWSLLLLLGVAVPLKRLAGVEMATMIAGPCHGIAFVVYAMVLLESWAAGLLPWRTSLLAFMAAPVPFGTLLVDRYLFPSREAIP